MNNASFCSSSLQGHSLKLNTKYSGVNDEKHEKRFYVFLMVVLKLILDTVDNN